MNERQPEMVSMTRMDWAWLDEDAHFRSQDRTHGRTYRLSKYGEDERCRHEHQVTRRAEHERVMAAHEVKRVLREADYIVRIPRTKAEIAQTRKIMGRSGHDLGPGLDFPEWSKDNP